MAITISGENNNDKILATDGVIDQISGFNIVGVITATTFTGNLIGNVTGNLTGNVNSTSPLLLQTGGYERFRITGNNELGIAGANYGSAGQVLTSGGSGSSVTWSTISTDLINDSSPQLGGDLDVNGKKIKFPDLTGSVNNILYFGTHDDLLIYHHADVNYIQCENARTLRFQYWTGSGNETLANFIPNGAVQLYHNNTKRLETFDNNPFVGISVTNDVVLNGSGDTAYRWAVGGNASSNFKWSMYYANADGALRLFDNVNSRTVSVWKNTGAIELNYQAGKRFETTNEGATFFTGSSSCVVRLTSNNSSVHVLQAFNNDLNIKAPSNGGISLYTNGSSESIRIASDGKVLMGVAANNGPAAPLHIYGGSNTTPILAFTRSSTHDDWQGGGIGLVDEGGSYKGALTFYTHGSSGTKNGAIVERLRIDSKGRVLIGATSSSYAYSALVVEGNATFTGGTGAIQLQGGFTNPSSQGSGLGEIRFTDANESEGAVIKAESDAAWSNGSSYPTYLQFKTTAASATSATERLRITSDGDVAIGRDSAQANYAAGTATTRLAVVKQSAGSGYHEIAHFTAGTDSDDTGAIVRITQFNNDRGFYIKSGRGSSDQAKAIFGLRNSGAVDQDVMTLLQGGSVNIGGDFTQTTHKFLVDNGTTLFKNRVYVRGSLSLMSTPFGANVTYDTGISVNASGYGGSMLCLCSRNYGAGTSTQAALYFLKFNYDGNHTPGVYYITGTNNFATFGQSGSNTLTVAMGASNNMFTVIESSV